MTWLESYIAERFTEIDRSEHGGLTQRGINAVLDEMGIRHREERRWYRRVFGRMGNAEQAVLAEKWRKDRAKLTASAGVPKRG